jgi:DNA-directed RNA polymerase specialized sigma24 family protein
VLQVRRELARSVGEHGRVDVGTDADAIAASLAEPRRFAVVYDRHAAVVFRFLVRRVGRDTADELLGETFRIAFERRAVFDCSRDSARPWLYGIATNLLAKHRRTEARRLRAMERLALAQGGSGGGTDAVADALAALPDGERDALLLFVWEDLDYDDIATALGIPVGTVRSRLHRARARLHAATARPGARIQR